MTRTVHTCLAGCGKRITWRFAICASCEKKYGRSPKEWPAWLAFLWRDEQRLRRQHRRIAQNESSFCELPDVVAIDDRVDVIYTTLEFDHHGTE